VSLYPTIKTALMAGTAVIESSAGLPVDRERRSQRRRHSSGRPDLSVAYVLPAVLPTSAVCETGGIATGHLAGATGLPCGSSWEKAGLARVKMVRIPLSEAR
jgi:hypothetical protein